MNHFVKRILILTAPLLLQKLFRGKKIFRKFGLALLLIILGTWLYSNYISPVLKESISSPSIAQLEFSDVVALYESQRSGVMISVEGKVTRILADDVKGVKHQRLIILTHDNVSALVAHNIDLASRIPLKVGDQVIIRGQYEWNHKGGIIHWTHHDPDKNHPEGWILHNESKYE